MTGPHVEDHPERQRFELRAQGQTAFIDYTRAEGQVALTHTEVPEALRGQGVGGRLVQGTLDLVRARGEQVLPQCGFVAAYLKRHPEQQDLVDPQQRADFGL